MNPELQTMALKAVADAKAERPGAVRLLAVKLLREEADSQAHDVRDYIVAVDWALAQNRPDPIRALHAEFAEAHADGASSNDIAQLLDDWLVAQGLPTVLYAR